MFRLGAFLFAMFFSGASFALEGSDAQDVDALIARADLLSLDQDAHWRGLLHFRGASRSEISPGAFFLSPDGSLDPKAEMAATLTAAFAPVEAAPDDHVLCRYPARMRFLQNRLNWTAPVSPACSDLQRWRRNGNITGVSLVFASGDLGNPASFFGHILMKFNEQGEGSSTAQDLDDRSVNFGALVPENENAFVYMLRGLVGGYPSSYSSTTYFQQRHDYGESQLRDLWDYRLNLDPDQVQLLVDHTWELQDARNTYYFLTRNCAYEFATLMSLVLGQDTLPDFKIWSTPADLFEELSEMTRPDGQPVVASVDLVASRQQGFRQAYAGLNGSEQIALRDLLSHLVKPETAAKPPSFEALDIASQIKVLEAALQYASFGREKFDRGSEEFAQAQGLQRQLVLLRLGQPAGAVLVPAPRDVGPPHQGHRTSLLQITPLSHSEFGAGTEIRFRPAYADQLSLYAGALPYSGVSMGELRLIYRDGEVWLRQLDLIRIDAFNVSPTGLPFDRARAWKFRLGAEDRDLACDRCMVGFAEGGVGSSVPLGARAAAVVFLGGRGVLEDGSDFSAELGPSIAVVGSIGEAFRLSAEASYLATVGGEHNDRFGAHAVMRFGESQTWDVRLRAGYLRPKDAESVSEIGFSASLFF